MQVKADVFPAVVGIAPPDSLTPEMELTFLPKGNPSKVEGFRLLDRCRIIVFNEKVIIGVDSPEGTKLVFSENITFFSKDKETKIFRVKTESGKFLAFKKDDNCGCGSKLRSWQPYGNTMMA